MNLETVLEQVSKGTLSIDEAKLMISPIKRSEKITVKLREADLTFSEMFYFLEKVLAYIPLQKSTEAIEALLDAVTPSDSIELLKVIAIVVDKLRSPGNYDFGLSFSKRYCKHEKILEELETNANCTPEFLEPLNEVGVKDLF